MIISRQNKNYYFWKETDMGDGGKKNKGKKETQKKAVLSLKEKRKLKKAKK